MHMIHDIVLVDKDMDFVDGLELVINREQSLKVTGRAHDGEMAIQVIMDLRPDIIVIDPSLEKLDGLHIIRQVHSSKNYSPMFYVVSNFATDSYLRILNQLNVDLFSLKPLRNELIIQNILHLIDSSAVAHVPDPVRSHVPVDPEELEDVVSELLDSMGLSSYLTSSKRTKDAVVACVLNETLMQNVNTLLYEHLAEKYETTKYAIERNIRNNIQWMIKQNTEVYQSVFGDQKVTNKAFLNVIVSYIKKYSMR